MEFMLLPLKRYADFSGRSRRMEYWMFQIFILLSILGVILLGGILAFISPPLGAFVGIIGYIAVAIGGLIPTIACGVRRLHDQEKSGWLMLLAFVPIASLVLLVFMFLEGTKGPNAYGPDPKETEAVKDIFN
jgi:uncharacterized membrane protein YhaH (DUF805 family)